MKNNIMSAVNKWPIFAAVGVSAHAFYKVYQQTFNVENESTKMSFYEDLNTPLDNNTQNAVNKVSDKFLFIMSPHQLALTHFYWSKSPTIHTMGTTLSRFGTYIGIPVHYRYQSPSEVNLSDLESRIPSTKENSELLKRLRESLVLSENAKKFALSSEIFTARSGHVIAKADGLLMIAGAYLTLRFPLLQFLEVASPIVLFAICVGVALLWTAVHYYLRRLYNYSLQASTDRKSAEFGEDFLQGGIEYLQKSADRNKVLRELDPQNAALMFESNGDEIQGFFDISKMSLSERLHHLQAVDEKLQQKNSNLNNSEGENS